MMTTAAFLSLGTTLSMLLLLLRAVRGGEAPGAATALRTVPPQVIEGVAACAAAACKQDVAACEADAACARCLPVCAAHMVQPEQTLRGHTSHSNVYYTTHDRCFTRCLGQGAAEGGASPARALASCVLSRCHSADPGYAGYRHGSLVYDPAERRRARTAVPVTRASLEGLDDAVVVQHYARAVPLVITGFKETCGHSLAFDSAAVVREAASGDRKLAELRQSGQGLPAGFPVDVASLGYLPLSQDLVGRVLNCTLPLAGARLHWVPDKLWGNTEMGRGTERHMDLQCSQYWSLQLSGTKRWTIHHTGAPDSDLGARGGGGFAQSPAPITGHVWETDVGPGDLLLFHPSWKHETVQLEANSFSINGHAGPVIAPRLDEAGARAGAEQAQALPWDSSLTRLPDECNGRYNDVLATGAGRRMGVGPAPAPGSSAPGHARGGGGGSGAAGRGQEHRAEL